MARRFFQCVKGFAFAGWLTVLKRETQNFAGDVELYFRSDGRFHFTLLPVHKRYVFIVARILCALCQ
jgi:hypothetical protein